MSIKSAEIIRNGMIAHSDLPRDDTGSGAVVSLDPDGLPGKRAAVVVFSHYPTDPRPRRAAETLVQLGMEVEVISLLSNSAEPRRATCNGVRIGRLPLKNWRGGKFAYCFQYGGFITAVFFILAARSLFRRYDLVHVHNMPDVLVFTALVPKLLGAKVLLDLHDPMPELMMSITGATDRGLYVRLLRQLEKLSVGFADLVITVNAACKTLFSMRSCAPDKVSVVMNAPDESIFQYRDAMPAQRVDASVGRSFVLMYHGSLVERHGLDLAVQALAEVKRSIPAAELRVYGARTPFLEKVMNSLQGTELQEAVRYFGVQKLEQVVEAIRECDVGIIPNRRSIFTAINTPTRIFEYLSQGKPVIAPAAPGIQDYFQQGELIYFELGSADDLAEKIKYAFFNPEEVSLTVKRGQKIYLDHKWSSERARFVSLVKKLVGTAGGRQRESPVPECRVREVFE